MLSRLCPWLLCLLSLHAATGHCSDAVSASERLEQAREKLASQVLRGSARVDAISWIDSTGRLHEHQSMRQSLHWPAPLESPSAAVRDLVREGQPAADSCPEGAAAAGLYTPMALSTRWSARFPANLRERLSQTVRLQWLGSEEAARPWRMFQAPTPYSSTYDQRLLAPPAADSAWRVEVRLDLLPTTSQRTERLQWRLVLNHQQRLITEHHAVMEVPVEPQPWGPSLWTEASWRVIEQQLTLWAGLLDRHMACVRPQPRLEAGLSGGWQLNLGSLAGVRVGDEWVLVDPAWLPERALEPGAIDRMVIARVVRVDDARAELVTLAGDVRLPRPGWVAQPLNPKMSGTLPASGLQQARR